MDVVLIVVVVNVFLFFFGPYHVSDFSSPTRDGAQALGSESTKDNKGISMLLLLKLLIKSKFYMKRQ